MLKKIDTSIKDLFIIEPDIFKDARGYFYESFSEKKYHDLGIDFKFVQDNISKSSYWYNSWITLSSWGLCTR